MGKENREKTVTVTSKDGFLNAVKAQYGEIVIKGSFAQEIGAILRKYNMGNKISNWGIFIGLFLWPILFAGIGGKILTRQLKQYDISEVKEDEVIVKRKK